MRRKASGSRKRLENAGPQAVRRIWRKRPRDRTRSGAGTSFATRARFACQWSMHSIVNVRRLNAGAAWPARACRRAGTMEEKTRCARVHLQSPRPRVRGAITQGLDAVEGQRQSLHRAGPPGCSVPVAAHGDLLSIADERGSIARAPAETRPGAPRSDPHGHPRRVAPAMQTSMLQIGAARILPQPGLKAESSFQIAPLQCDRAANMPFRRSGSSSDGIPNGGVCRHKGTRRHRDPWRESRCVQPSSPGCAATRV